ncbi:MAG: group II intron reverse transcriptase/maturase [Gemmatimonadota bacterium]|nr:MAG: group II intron reverse transcriptase/maturase [Gemmatimonadota bacterium]
MKRTDNTQRRSQEPLPERVPFAVIPTGETPSIEGWAQRAVWTDRMLRALLNKTVKGGRWHSLIDKVYSELNLYTAARHVCGKKGAAGIDHQTTEEFDRHLIVETRRLSEQIRGDTYQAQAVRRVWIPKPGNATSQRPLGIPTVRDRVVQKALVNVIEPILDHTFHDRSFGFRHGRSCHDALRLVEDQLRDGYVYVVDADLKGYFDSIPQDKLLQQVRESISDHRVLKLIEHFLNQRVMEELREWTADAGVPQGAVLSPVLSNVYLNPLDHLMAEDGFMMVRYADDFVILCRSEFEADVALQTVREWVEAAGLTLHPTKTKIVDSRVNSFQFLGYSFRGEQIHPRSDSLNKLKHTIRQKTPRKSGVPLEFTIASLNSTLRGWFGYFRHARWPVFKATDAMVRRRLRRILQKRHRKNPRRLPATTRWPNAYFTDLGLFSLREAHFRFAQSPRGPD